MPTRPLSRFLPLLALACLSLGHGGSNGDGGGGCGGGDSHGHEEEDVHARASGAACPPQGAPTVDDFGRGFLQTHCLSCHSRAVTGAAREGAPLGVDFDTLEEVRQQAAAIDAHSAAGPLAVNTSMPPASRPPPSMDERVRLGQWLSCGAP